MIAKNDPIRIVAATDGYQDDALGLALSYVGAVLRARSLTSSDVVLLTHTKQQLSGTSLASMLGSSATKALLAGKPLGIPSGNLRHVTLRTMSNIRPGCILIPFYADEKMLDEVDSKSGTLAVIAVPDQEGDAASWAQRWNATIHGQKKAPPAALITDPVIASAMKSVTLLCNISHGTMQTKDIVHANEIFRILRNKGHHLVPEQIKSWAIREKWHPGAASDLAKVAAKVKALKTKPSISSFHDPEGRYDRWKNGE